MVAGGQKSAAAKAGAAAMGAPGLRRVEGKGNMERNDILAMEAMKRNKLSMEQPGNGRRQTNNFWVVIQIT